MPSVDRFDLLRERAALIKERAEAIEAVKEEYRKKIDSVNESLHSLIPPPKPPAIEKYTEPDSSPRRYCKACGEVLLRANQDNAETIEKVVAWEIGREKDYVGWAAVRSMAKKDYCCHCCEVGDGHSCWCQSEQQVAERLKLMEEDNQNA